MNTLKAERRSMDIKAKKLRREGFVTGNVFGREMKESVPVKMDKAEVDRLLKKSNKGSQIMLDIGGKQYNVLIKDIQYNPLKGQVDEIDFQALVSDEKVHSVAEVVLLNHDKVLSGVLQLQLEEIAFQAYPSALVDRVEIDAEALRIGQSVKVKDLSIAKNKEIDLITDPEATVVTLSEVHNAAVDEDSEAEE